MKPENSKEEILKKVRQALGKGDNIPEAPELASPVLKPFADSDTAITFAENFIKTKGIFQFCENENDFIGHLKNYISSQNTNNIYCWEKELSGKLFNAGIKSEISDSDFIKADIGITLCESLIARTGSILVSSGSEAGRRLGVFPHIHIVVAYTSQIVAEIAHGLSGLKAKYNNKIPSMISLVTGPSRTADIEKTLVLGAHGPKELVLFLIDDNGHS
jgi:L-lactate dehydrogenase complex protein LldG